MTPLERLKAYVPPFVSMRIADLTSPTGEVVRFVWFGSHNIVTVLTIEDKKQLGRAEARSCWRTFRKAGWTMKLVTPYLGAADLSPAGFRSLLDAQKKQVIV